LEARIRPYRNGKDLTARPRGVFLINLFGLTESEVITQFPQLYQHVFTHVKPERDVNNRKKLKGIWWEFGETRKGLRSALKGLKRFIATPETAKHRVFQFLETEIEPDHMLVALALDDAFHLGVLSSKIHVVWSLATGSWLGVGNDSVYTSSRCFQTFPFPTPTEPQKARIPELAETLDAHRKRQQAQHPSLTLTDLYNMVEKLKRSDGSGGEVMNAKDQTTHQQGLASVVLSLHKQLDTAVAEAYGWPVDLPEPEILTRLVRLNQERAQEEASGQIRYLRPSYQAPEQQQLGLGLEAPVTAGVEPASQTAGPHPGRRSWPSRCRPSARSCKAPKARSGRRRWRRVLWASAPPPSSPCSIRWPRWRCCG